MALYRGIGGAGDSTTDATVTAVTTQATNAASSASAAAESASNAAISESNAAGSATTASGHATTALGHANDASGYASDAQTALGATQAVLANAETVYDNFDDRYLGDKASNPTLDNDGNALLTGALYFNTTDGVMKVYDGSEWLAAYASLGGALLATNNLSDLDNATTARTNLGLGTAATTASTDYATAAQGALADSALQSSDIGSTVQGYDADTVKYDDVNPSFTDTGAIKVPTGNTSQQPGTPVAGQFRFNSETGQFEGYNGTAWGAIAGGSGGGAGLQDMFLLMGA